MLVFAASAAWAATFNVDSTTDAVDAVPGNGVCLTAGAACTLRAAIQEANALAGTDTINLPAGSFGITIAGSDDIAAVGDLDITGSLTISGVGSAGSTIDGSGLDRVLDVHSGIVSISDVTIRDGIIGNKGGGIRNFASLTLTDCVVTSNSATEGGGIHVEGVTSTLTLDSVTVLLNTAGKGGGVRMATAGSSATLTDVTFDRNVASGEGGGMAVEQADASFSRVTFMDNDADTGAALWTKGGSSDVSLTNVTISGNDSTGEAGGIWAEGNTLTLTNVTVANNTASVKGGGIRPKAGTVTLKNTIFSGNTPDNCERAVTSAGYNIDSGATCALPVGESNIDPLLAPPPLQDNGGPTLTHALQAGSPAIDAVLAGCPPPGTDQRGVIRPQGANCDIGAVEALPPLKLVKRAFQSNGTPIASGSTVPTGMQVRFLLYINNPGGLVADVSLQDVLAPDFLYVAGSTRYDNSVASCALTDCTPAEEAAIFAAADPGTIGTDAVDGDVVSFAGVTLNVGNSAVANAQLNIAAGKIWAVVFTTRMQ